MIDLQCGTSSTVISIANTHSLSDNNQYNNQVQTFEATIEQGTIYFEFEPFDNSNDACPIIQYKVKDVVITETNHAHDTPNYIYGRDSTGKFVFEMDKINPGYTTSTCATATSGNSNCDRAQPVNLNNSQTFTASSSNIFTTAFSPDDVAQHPDEQQTSLKREFAVIGTPFGSPSYTD